MDDIKALKEALEGGPTPGEWKVCTEPANEFWLKGRTIGAADPKDARRVCDAFSIGTPPDPGSMFEANARYIAACSPARIARLLERLEKAEMDAGRWRMQIVIDDDSVNQTQQCPRSSRDYWEAINAGYTREYAIDAAMAQKEQT